MQYVLILGLLIGFALLAVIAKRIASWSHPQMALALLGCAFYGGLPFILLRAGAIKVTALQNILAGVYLLAFTIVGSLVLNSKLVRRRD